MSLFYISALLLVGIGLAHSLLGERYILRRLERLDNLPRLTLGGHELMTQVLRIAWHITTIAWFGIAGFLVLMAHDALTNKSAAVVVGATFIPCAIIAGISSRGKHLSWLVFLAVGVITLYGAFA